MVFLSPIEERFSIHQATILNIHISLHHIGIKINKNYIITSNMYPPLVRTTKTTLFIQPFDVP
jgi:hypothetical protein